MALEDFMEYKETKEAVFLERPNRFCANVLIDNVPEEVHVKNTGRCKELLIPGAKVILEKAQNPERKTRYSLVSVYKGDMLVNMDSQAPNAVVFEAIRAGKIAQIGAPVCLRREVRFGNSRFDLYFENRGRKGFVEVKGVTLEENKTVSFPDAPTERGRKHIYELIKAKKEGYEAYIFFLIQMKGPKKFMPNALHDAKFAKALREACNAGVTILAYDSVVKKSSIEMDSPVEILI